MDFKKVEYYEEYKVLLSVKAIEIGLYEIWNNYCNNTITLGEYSVRIMESVINSKLSYNVKADLYDFMMNLKHIFPYIEIKQCNLTKHLYWNSEKTLLMFLTSNNFYGYVSVHRNTNIKHLYFVHKDNRIQSLGIEKG